MTSAALAELKSMPIEPGYLRIPQPTSRIFNLQGYQALRRFNTTGHMRAEPFEMPHVPGIDALCFSLECALPENRIVNSAARDTGLGRAVNHETLPDTSEEGQRLITAHAIHPVDGVGGRDCHAFRERSLRGPPKSSNLRE